MIKLKDLLKEAAEERLTLVWTRNSAKPIAQAIGGQIIGSVASIGRSAHDLDIRVPVYTEETENKLKEFGFNKTGFRTIASTELRRMRFRYSTKKQRIEIFVNLHGKKIDIWHDAND